MLLPPPEPGEEVAWVRTHLADLVSDEVTSSTRFTGTQRAADDALAGLDLRGYAMRRNEVWPADRRGATELSPYIRHGLIHLPEVWDRARGPESDVTAFRDELLWQEYARHLYAHLGSRSAVDLRYHQSTGGRSDPIDTTGAGGIERHWPTDMACLSVALEELHTDGYLTNQARLWLASHWAVAGRVPWRPGDDHFFRHLLDGSRAANRLGWQWVTGTATGRPYRFGRGQVERRAPGLCSRCSLASRCPIEGSSDPDEPVAISPPPDLRADPVSAGGPTGPVIRSSPDAVWITAESLGDRDPASLGHPALPRIFVVDRPLLARLALSSKRLVFLAQRLAELATTEVVEIHLGSPSDVLADRRVAATYSPVPGWRRIAAIIEPVAVHPWPWLRRPGGRLGSYTAWRRSSEP